MPAKAIRASSTASGRSPARACTRRRRSSPLPPLSLLDDAPPAQESVAVETLEFTSRLIEKKLVSAISQAGARVVKYEHRMRIKWSLEQDKLAVLTVLMLRGLQTAGEIRIDGAPVRTGQLAVLGPGDTVTINGAVNQESRTPALDVVVLGGAPIREPIAMAGRDDDVHAS